MQDVFKITAVTYTGCLIARTSLLIIFLYKYLRTIHFFLNTKQHRFVGPVGTFKYFKSGIVDGCL